MIRHIWKTGIVIFLTILFHESESLKCYRCISLSCPDSPAFCDRVKIFVLERLNDIYYSYDRVPLCPDLSEEDAWVDEIRTAQSCREEGSGEATCALGRFRVTTTITDNNKNVTSYGTSLGCGKRKLLDFTKKAIKKSECSIVTGESVPKFSLKHFLEIEHCSTVTEMCRNRDFCINPEYSEVRIFQDDKEEGSRFTLPVILAIIVLIALIAGVLTLMGIKYDV